jgi:diguanylate cyclase (GGDEF)-like protein
LTYARRLMLLIERSHPLTITAVQSAIVVILAAAMSALWHHYIGRTHNTLGYDVLAALVIAGILSPIFLYPSFLAAYRLRQANKTIQKQALTDYLTQLPNYFALCEEIQNRLPNSEGQPALAVYFLDLDRFKEVNDSLGHDVGNQLIVAVAEKLRGSISDDAFVARFGGDEFVVLQPIDGSVSEAKELVSSIREAVAGSYELAGHCVRVDVTIGTAIAPHDAQDASSLLKAADMALYHAKKWGLPASSFAPELARKADQNRELDGQLHAALDQDQFFLLYQPIVSAANTSQIVGVEALLRWRLPNGRAVSPDDFIAAAERSGAIVEIGEWVLRQACEECLKWPDHIGVSVNVSPVQFFRSDFLDVVRRVLDETGLPAARLTLEITETTLISDTKFVGPTFKELRAMGVQLALDDFGAGFCGLSYLRHFEIDKVKVDKSIIDHASDDLKSLSVLTGVARIAKESMIGVVIEGVDSAEKEALIRGHGIATELQGFLYFVPLQPAEVRSVLAAGSADGRRGAGRVRARISL